MYFNIVKRRVDSHEFVNITKSYKCFGQNDRQMESKAKSLCSVVNLIRLFYNKYYYKVEFDFE